MIAAAALMRTASERECRRISRARLAAQCGGSIEKSNVFHYNKET